MFQIIFGILERIDRNVPFNFVLTDGKFGLFGQWICLSDIYFTTKKYDAN